MNRSFILAGIIAAGIIAWMASGQLGANNDPGPPETEPAAQDAQAAFRVRAVAFTASERTVFLQLRGRTQALRTVSVRAETSGRVVELPVQEGAIVEAGALLCQLDVRDREARVAQAKAALRQRTLEYEAAQQLSGRGFRSETQAAGAQADLEEARANLRSAELDLANTRVTAPFDGIMDNYNVEIGDLMQTGETCTTVVDLDPFLVIAQVAEKEVSGLEVNTPAQAQLITGETVTGTIRFISARAQEATRTFRVEIEVPNPDLAVRREGVTAEILVPRNTVYAQKIPASFLTLNALGQIGVRTVDADSIVRFMPVEVVEDAGEGIWVTGLPQEVTIISVGQDYVVDGQKVEAVVVPAESDAAPEDAMDTNSDLRLISAPIIEQMRK